VALPTCNPTTFKGLIENPSVAVTALQPARQASPPRAAVAADFRLPGRASAWRLPRRTPSALQPQQQADGSKQQAPPVLMSRRARLWQMPGRLVSARQASEHSQT
jgi:hypothetical protein